MTEHGARYSGILCQLNRTVMSEISQCFHQQKVLCSYSSISVSSCGSVIQKLSIMRYRPKCLLIPATNISTLSPPIVTSHRRPPYASHEPLHTIAGGNLQTGTGISRSSPCTGTAFGLSTQGSRISFYCYFTISTRRMKAWTGRLFDRIVSVLAFSSTWIELLRSVNLSFSNGGAMTRMGNVESHELHTR
jgi:hypothetical protein